jgi:hypothetical protein
MQRVERLVVGLGSIGLAMMWRGFIVSPRARELVTVSTWFPPLKFVDFVTAPLGLCGVAVLASSPQLSVPRRIGGVLAVCSAALWPVLKLPHMSPVVLRLSASHGIHLHDVLALPMLACALTLLAPWRAPLAILRSPIRVRLAPRWSS